jgi:glycosyltransferase involved in cell wall biosynthesis
LEGHQVDRLTAKSRMSTALNGQPGRILLATTADESLDLMRGFPGFLVDGGWDVHVVSTGGPRLTALGAMRGITVHGLPMARLPKPMADARALARWIQLLRRVRPDVVAVGTPKAGLLSMIASACLGVRFRVYILRGLRAETARGLLWALLVATEWVAMACSHVVLAVSPSLKVRAEQMHLCPAEKLVVLGSGSSNGIDLDVFSTGVPEPPSEWELEPGLPVLGYVGRITSDKGLIHFADALRLMRQSGSRCQLLLIGRAEDERGAPIIQRLIDAGQRVIEVGYLDDPRAAYAAMDVICLPSLREGFPNVILEAAAAGRPAVVSDATGNVDAVVDGVTGYVVPLGNVEVLASALIRLLRDRNLSRAMGSAARARVAKEFDRVQLWQKTDSLMRSNGAHHRSRANS